MPDGVKRNRSVVSSKNKRRRIIQKRTLPFEPRRRNNPSRGTPIKELTNNTTFPGEVELISEKICHYDTYRSDFRGKFMHVIPKERGLDSRCETCSRKGSKEEGRIEFGEYEISKTFHVILCFECAKKIRGLYL